MSATAPTAPTALIVNRGPDRSVLNALQRGDAKGLADAMKNDPVALAAFAIEVRRESVATLGDYEAFVRKTDDGSLRQVIRPVTLSVKDGTLYQIPAWRPVCTVREHPCFGTAIDTKEHTAGYKWGNVVLEPTRAHVSYPGYVALNSVASCAVGQPPTIMVDGQQRTNPYVERATRKDGRPGNVQRIVVGICVVGPAPATGSLSVVTYTLDYDPAKDLAHMLADVAKNHPKACVLANEDESQGKAGWSFVPISDGVGFWFDLSNAEILEVYKDYINLQGNALKKAQTVARRNAMRSHPALGGIAQTVTVDKAGLARVAVCGWAPAEGDDIARWRDLSERLARGLPLQQIEQITDLSGSYDPAAEHDPVHATDEGARPAPTVAAAAAPAAIDPATEERNRLIEYIDDGIRLLDPKVVADLKYDPSGPMEDLQRCKAEIDRMADA